MDRRLFLSAASGALLAAAGRAWSAAPADKPLRILILGGTQFLGVHITERALARGHKVTLFNRGKTHTELFPQVEKLQGDRDGQLDILKGHTWDAVIDDSGYVPRHVRLSAQLLAPTIKQYLYVSSISAYAGFTTPNDEDSALGKLADPGTEKVDGGSYGPLKALCEQEVKRALPGRFTIIRPGYVAGPQDHTDRFTYWPARAARGAEMLVPGTPRDPIQYIDVRDLARFAIDALEHGTVGTFNLVTPPGKFTMGDLITACIAGAAELAHPTVAPRPTWVPTGFIAKHDASVLDTIPIWEPLSGDTAAFAQISASRALRAGLHITLIGQTVRDTLKWHLARSNRERTHLKAGLAPEGEQALLTAWHRAAAAASASAS
jgi:2'-hydroxyisoflavone reductase